MLNEEQLDYITSLKKTHPNVSKEDLREALLGSEWTEIEIMEAISLYNEDTNSNSNPDSHSNPSSNEKPKSYPIEEDDVEKTSNPETDEDTPVVTVRKSSSKLVSIITAFLIIILFIVLIVVGSMVFFKMSLSEVINFITVDFANNVAERIGG